MARIRSINPAAPVDEDVATLSIWARYAWAYLPCHADREGRLKDAPFTLAHAILPTGGADMNAILDELATARHVVRYQVDGRRFIQIRNFTKYQTPHVREAASEIPPVPVEHQASPEKAGLAPVQHEASTPIPDPDPDPSPVISLCSDPIPVASGSGRAIPVPPSTWSAGEWRDKFGAAWCKRYDTMTGYGMTSDSRAVGALSDLLASKTTADRLGFQERASAMFAEFLADESPRVIAARHPFVFFVTAFGGLVVEKRSARAGPESFAAQQQDATIAAAMQLSAKQEAKRR